MLDRLTPRLARVSTDNQVPAETGECETGEGNDQANRYPYDRHADDDPKNEQGEAEQNGEDAQDR